MFEIKGESEHFVVKLKAPVKGKLADVFGASFHIQKGTKIIVSVPVELKSKFSTRDEISFQIIIDKAQIGDAFLTLRCGKPNIETMYRIALKDFVVKEP